ncbi:MAG TPA: RNA polymerase sigma factor SigJ [Solirubrobacterales bacterium]|nr:RNA polymerase sigma factor SigJ [Solirubrobacterales bacterium]
MTESGQKDLAARFEQNRDRLRAVAFRMLGASGEADEAVQEAWLRLDRADPEVIEDLPSWLTTVVARICLDMLRARQARHEEPLGPHVPDPIVSPAAGGDPEHEALVADSVGLAMLGVLETLSPEERVAFVLHDTFAVPFEQVADLLDRSPAAARKAASRARQRVEAEPTEPDVDLERQREVVDAFFAAAREGDFDALVAVLHPEIVLRSDGGEARPTANHVIRGAAEVAGRALTFAHLSPHVRPVLVNGVAGVLVAPEGKPFSVMAFTVAGGRVVAIDALADPERLARLEFGLGT